MTYLIFAIVLSAVLAWAVVWWHRRPKSLERGIDEFSAGLDALAPRPPGDNRSRRRSAGRAHRRRDLER